VRFELHDPVGQLDLFEELVLLLQVHGANPERVRDQAAKAAQSHGGQREHRRRALELDITAEPHGFPVAVEAALDEAGTGQQDRHGES
jgi:hypothetical protein